MTQGKRKIQPREVEPMATFLRMSVGQLMQANNGVPLDKLRPPLLDHGADGVPPLRVLRAEPVQIGRWMVEGTEVSMLGRPDLLWFAPRAFALIVQDEANAPVYHPRDHVLVNPDLPLRDGDDAVFCSQNDPDIRGRVQVILARLLRKNHTTWHVRQYSESAERRLPKKDWPGCWKICARYIH